jgi:hypothetical protein
MFMQIAVGAIGIGIVLMVGYLVISNVRTSLPTPQAANPCIGQVGNVSRPDCNGGDNTSSTIDEASYVTALTDTQTTIFAGFALIAVGIIVLAAFGLITVFR